MENINMYKRTNLWHTLVSLTKIMDCLKILI